MQKTLLISALHSKSGGGLTYIHGLINELAGRAEEVKVIVLRNKAYARHIPTFPNITYIDVPMPEQSALGILWEQLIVPYYSHKLSVDHTLFNANYCAFFAKKPAIILHTDTRVRQIVTHPLAKLYWYSLHALTALSILRARPVFKVSNSVASTWEKYLKNKETPALYAGLMTKNVPNMSGILGHGFHIVTVGDIYPQKHYDIMVEALAQVLPHIPDAKLHIIGAIHNRESMQALQHRISAHKLQSRVILHGKKAHIETLTAIKAADVYLSTSTIEALNIPLIEALQLGTNIIASDIPAHREVLEDTGAALISPQDTAGYVNAILTLKDTPQDIKNHPRHIYTWQQVVDLLLASL